MSNQDLESALDQFDRTEANLTILESLWSDHEELCISHGWMDVDRIKMKRIAVRFEEYVRALPAISGFTCTPKLMTVDEIGQARIDALEVGFPETITDTEEAIFQPGSDLVSYRQLLSTARRDLIRGSITETVTKIDDLLGLGTNETTEGRCFSADDGWEQLGSLVRTFDRLFGTERPSSRRWTDLYRHIRFAEPHDLRDIVEQDWPAVKQAVTSHDFADSPYQVHTSDLSTLVEESPAGPVSAQLDWTLLSPADFEYLVYDLLVNSDGYENARLDMETNASDQGRDISVDRVTRDALNGVRSERVMVQCKHYQSTSVGLDDCRKAVEQSRLWGPPAVRVVVMATTGRFVNQAIQWQEQREYEGARPEVQLWSGPHLESILAAKPAVRISHGLSARPR